MSELLGYEYPLSDAFLKKFYRNLAEDFDVADQSWRKVNWKAGVLLAVIDACFTDVPSVPDESKVRTCLLKTMNNFASQAAAYSSNRNDKICQKCFLSTRDRLASLFLDFLLTEYKAGKMKERDGKTMYRCFEIRPWLMNYLRSAKKATRLP